MSTVGIDDDIPTDLGCITTTGNTSATVSIDKFFIYPFVGGVKNV
jgi:hypothetical protein